MKDKILEILIDLLPELNKITVDFMIRSGVPSNSNLVKNTSFVITENGLNLMSNYYFQYLDSGRKRYVRKVPIKALIDWIKRYHIIPRRGMTITSLAFAIQTSIYKHGIKPRGYFDRIMFITTKLVEKEIADETIEIIADQVMNVMTETKYATEVK